MIRVTFSCLFSQVYAGAGKVAEPINVWSVPLSAGSNVLCVIFCCDGKIFLSK
jgi:hypothetical protein